MSTPQVEFALFDTAIGRCAIAWGMRGIVATQLPQLGDWSARARMLRRFPGAREAEPPEAIRRTIDDVVALLAGETRRFEGVELDFSAVPPFNRRVYEVARTIAPGSTMSYGEIAAALGDRNAARDVGKALGENPFPIVVPCHRVLAAGGKSGGFSAPGGVRTKARLLEIEGALPPPAPSLFDGIR